MISTERHIARKLDAVVDEFAMQKAGRKKFNWPKKSCYTFSNTQLGDKV